MRRKAQRANARQGPAAPPLRATARIAAEAAPTGWPTPTNNGERALFIARTRQRKPAKRPAQKCEANRLHDPIAGSIAARLGCDKLPRGNLPNTQTRTSSIAFPCSRMAWQFRLRLGPGLCLPETFLSKHKKQRSMSAVFGKHSFSANSQRTLLAAIGCGAFPREGCLAFPLA